MLTVLKTCCVKEVSTALPFRISILSSKNLRVHASIIADCVGNGGGRWRPDSKGAGEKHVAAQSRALMSNRRRLSERESVGLRS